MVRSPMNRGREAIVTNHIHTRKKCCHCGKQGHAAADCQFKDSICHKCGKLGHITKVCHIKSVTLTECIETDLLPSAHTDDVVFRVDN